MTAGGYLRRYVRGYPASLGKVNLVQGYQVVKEEVMCGRDHLSVWVVAGKMAPLELYMKGIVVAYRAVN